MIIFIIKQDNYFKNWFDEVVMYNFGLLLLPMDRHGSNHPLHNEI